MSKSYPEITKSISANLKPLRKDISGVMQGFSAMAQAAGKAGALDMKTKELIALAIGIATRCDGCIGFHTDALDQARRYARGIRGGSGHGRFIWAAVRR